MNQDKIAKYIKMIRIKNKLTQSQFAEKLNVTCQAVSKWETGKSIPDIDTLNNICSSFNVSIDEIINGKKAKHYFFYIIILLFAVICVLVFLLFNHSDKINLGSLNSKCSDFKITGSAAYNKEKTSFLINNIEYCGEEDKTVYKKIDCALYEKNLKDSILISNCNYSKNNITLVDYLQNIKISVDDYNTICKEPSKSKIYLEITAEETNNKSVRFKIPLELTKEC